jgi:hypothetical protein
MKSFAEIKEKFQKLRSLSKEQKRRLYIALLIALVVAIAVTVIAAFFPGLAGGLLIAAFCILLLVSWIVAGFVIFKPLFFVSAELSLMIFLAQSYCAVPKDARTADDSLKFLLVFGLAYIAVVFFKSMYKEMENVLATAKKIGKGESPALFVVLFVAFIGVFLFQLYQVINPIVQNLCIYSSLK